MNVETKTKRAMVLAAVAGAFVWALIIYGVLAVV